jgi:uncharacterized membrane protein HdeD (DUF308 family)
MLRKVQETVENLWWMFVFQGILTVIFGLIALFWPGVTLVAVVYFFAAYVFVMGLVLAARGLMRMKTEQSWWFLVLIGIMAILFGIYLLAYPQVAISSFLSIVGVLLLAKGVFDLFLAAYVVRTTEGRILWMLSGAVGIVAAIVLWQFPVATGVAFIWVIGLYALVAGTIGLVYAYRARGFIDKVKMELKLKKPKKK